MTNEQRLLTEDGWILAVTKEKAIRETSERPRRLCPYAQPPAVVSERSKAPRSLRLPRRYNRIANGVLGWLRTGPACPGPVLSERMLDLYARY